ncbi:MAG: hypothetical protein EXR87_06600 [Gammaproteobacteria bacterium]|nr:hypothetical protein [Gammaproteobacteria bacterium]
MKLSDELLQAYFDGELDLVARAEIEAAIERDPGIARIALEHRSARKPGQAASQAAPARRVKAAVKPAVSAPREEVVPPQAQTVAPPEAAAPQFQLPQWLVPAAVLALGVAVGKFALSGADAPYTESESGLVARGELAWALDGQLGGDTGTGDVRVGSSFIDRSGAYCRTFRLQHEAPFAGLACHLGDEWQLPLFIAAAPGEIGSHEVTVMPMAVLRAVDAAIDGEPLDAAAEVAARDAGWQAVPQPLEAE